MSASTPASNYTPGKAALPVEHKGLLTLAVMGASIIQILDSTIANVAIPHMQTSLGATIDSVTWVLTSYILASAVAMPAAGWLSDRIGSRRLFLFAVAGFIITSMLCGVATNLTQMVLFRIFQGICAAFIGPLSQTILLDINPPEKAPRAMQVWGMGIMIAPIMGPMIGGWLTESYNWRWVFYINLPIGIPTLALLWWLLPSRKITDRKLDIFGFAMLALGLASLQLMLDRGQHEDWFESWEIIIELGVAIAAFWMFAIHSMTTKKPLFDPNMVTNGNFLTALMFGSLIGLMMYGIFALLPPMLQNIYGYTVFDTGALLAPRGIGILVGMIAAGRLVTFLDIRWIIFSGFSLVALSMWMMTGWALEMGVSQLIIVGLVQGFGMGITFMPTNVIAFSTLPLSVRTDASSLLYLARSLGGSLGISISVTMLTRSMQVNHEELAARITSSSFSVIDPATADRFGVLGEAVMRMLDMEVNRQAAMIAYLSDFQLMFYMVLAFLPLVLLIKPVKPEVGPPQHLPD
ncbi:MAG: DHA2 family efflux MFS transporter permease subunit [Sphingomonadales bacterium]|jgi:DHA2 family multidrug resistance protein|nr:DHA2 family efflux MFS transporter permease subunit [Sphingomonadales bacterium]MBK9003739.1 DHA2 family efflux MFS transporter permease subunit [Sphingomonadales bacterium]MBK9268913.1 DHA2 family efflux MFS transporter permease subunit [Sphingomonadales bacterium]MBP6434816.1 DHA2 family efflux MFS transporter permease subunit [Sphingorhabdus sp.]